MSEPEPQSDRPNAASKNETSPSTPSIIVDDTPHDAFSALRSPVFALYVLGSLLTTMGVQMRFGALTWEVYERTGDKRNLAGVGLSLLIPIVLLFLPAGQIVDRVDRKKILAVSTFIGLICSLGLATISAAEWNVLWVYPLLVVHGTARAFHQPARNAYFPSLIPIQHYANGVMWTSGMFQFSTVVGPMLAGLLIAATGLPSVVYGVDFLFGLVFLVILSFLPAGIPENRGETRSIASLFSGIAFVWNTPLLLAAILLDMFAVLLGSATGLLPVFCKDVLNTSEWMYGLMRSAPGLGAIAMSLMLATLPPTQRAGRLLLYSVAAFGVFTIVFGLSRNIWLSLTMLTLLGAVDMVSVVVRQTLMQLYTPDALRGRVSAVTSLFISISNELGEVESTTVAHLFERDGDIEYGPTVSVVSGGVGTMAVVAAVAAASPALREFGKLNQQPRRG